MRKNEFISMRAERMHNAIKNSSFDFPGKAETLGVLAKINDPLSLLEAITKLRSGNAVIGLICDDLRDLDQTVMHMEFDPDTATASKKRQVVKSVESPIVANYATVEPIKADPLDFDFADDPKPAKDEPAKAEPAKVEPAKEPETSLKAVTVDDIRALAIKAAKAGKMAVVTAYLKAVGVPKVQDLDPAKFADFIAAMHKAGV